MANLLEDKSITNHRDRYYATLICSSCFSVIHVSLAPQKDPLPVAEASVRAACSMSGTVDTSHKAVLADYATACLRCDDMERLQDVIHVLQHMPSTTAGLLESLWPTHAEAQLCE